MEYKYIVNDEFHYEKNKKIYTIYRIFLPEVVEHCTFDLPIQFEFENRLKAGFLSNEKKIIHESQEIRCFDKLNTFLQSSKYSIKRILFHIGVIDSIFTDSMTLESTFATTSTYQTDLITTNISEKCKILFYKSIREFFVHFVDDLNDIIYIIIIFIFIIFIIQKCIIQKYVRKLESRIKK